MKILLLGGSGQLGREFLKRASDLHFQVSAPVRKEVSVLDREQLLFLCEKIRPEVIVHSAAYTNVDRAEEEPELAVAVNAGGARHVAEGALKVGARVLYISTDYVFDGMKGRPYQESDPANPLSVYGRSKFEGEQYLHEALGDRLVIVRTSSLHSMYGTNFVNTMLSLFQKKTPLRVVHDQIMSPTWAGWLAEVMLDICRMEASGTYHASCSGETTWYEFACTIRELAGLTVAEIPIEPISAAEYGAKAPRPAYSTLDCGRLRQLLGRELLDWHAGLQGHLQDLQRARSALLAPHTS